MTQPSNDAMPIHRFYLQIDGVNLAVFMEIDGLQVETDIFEYSEGGNNGFLHKLPGQTRVSNLTLKRGMVSTNELFNWYMKVASGTIERRNLSVIIYTHDGSEMRRWNFFDAYPVRWVGPALNTDTTSP
ncbi:phage tail protein, partial [Oscillochloris sp. ZM17-4]|uniref:phage tail protein n=1 Tax=Oscillochloris sp. ZM17-4 TaxID=2866714 RepID=UPI001C73DCA8